MISFNFKKVSERLDFGAVNLPKKLLNQRLLLNCAINLGICALGISANAYEIFVVPIDMSRSRASVTRRT